MSFIVSGDAASSCNPIYFTTLDACLKALPEVINYPILIEVASFGNLGKLQLSNKIFGPSGSLEIVNRNSSFAGAASVSGNSLSIDEIGAFSLFSVADSVSSLFDNTGKSKPSVVWDLVNAKTYSTNQSIASGAAADYYKDLRYSTENQYVFTRRVGRDQLGVMTASLKSSVSGFDNTKANVGLASEKLLFDNYDSVARTVDQMDLYDASTINEITDTVFFPPNNLTDGVDNHDAVAAMVYYNHLDSISVNNCNGPIYIRNFTVDGEKSREKGIEILNSTVNLERCSVSRCTKAGLFASNSNLKLLRGFVSYRNYGFNGLNRIGQPYRHKVINYEKSDNYAAGIFLENSTIEFKDTYARDIQKSFDSSSLIYDDSVYIEGLPTPSQEALYCLSRNDIGLWAVNSNILGGRTELAGSSLTSWQDATQIFSELNTEAGIKIHNCTLDLKGRFTLYGNYRGLDSLNSNLSFDFFKAYGNQKEGIKLDNCKLLYNNNVYSGYLHLDSLYDTSKNDYLQHQVTLLANGTAIQANKSSIKPLYTSSMPSVYESFMVSGTHGQYQEGSSVFADVIVKPNIILDSSELDAIGLSVYPLANGFRDHPCLGEAISARNNSTVYLRGTSDFANKIIGGNTDDVQHKRVGVYATNNSTVAIQGPTVIARFGVDVLVDNNSVLEITPHRDLEGQLLASSFYLSSNLNHTMVELHSTRSCLVADNGSVINMTDLGAYEGLWRNTDGTYGPAIDFSNLDYLQGSVGNYIQSISGGSLQFYPNGFTDLTGVAYDPVSVLSDPEKKNFTLGSYTPQPYYYLKEIPIDPGEKVEGNGVGVSSVTTGGMCVRALNKSKVTAMNVHFPLGHPQMSSIIYDFQGVDGEGPNCTRYPIWNICDDSILRAGYLSVSGKHPQDAGYVGPSGNWHSASEAPSSTPDTSGLSVLDYFGPDENSLNRFGNTIFRNYGPFRLYFSVDPIANLLLNASGNDLSGYISQVFAQGYNFSGPASAGYIGLPAGTPSEYKKGYFITSSNETSDAGFYYASAIVHSPRTFKAILDDSAMNTFANAKHNTVNKSGLANVVTRYEPYDALPGDSTILKEYGTGVVSVTNFDIRKLN
jgi:hypothetical protein